MSVRKIEFSEFTAEKPYGAKPADLIKKSLICFIKVYKPLDCSLLLQHDRPEEIFKSYLERCYVITIWYQAGMSRLRQGHRHSRGQLWPFEKSIDLCTQKNEDLSQQLQLGSARLNNDP
jgi:hypothetical protein